jgi:hypothetical protein
MRRLPATLFVLLREWMLAYNDSVPQSTLLAPARAASMKSTLADH